MTVYTYTNPAEIQTAFITLSKLEKRRADKAAKLQAKIADLTAKHEAEATSDIAEIAAIRAAIAAYAEAICRDRLRVLQSAEGLYRLGIGGTAAGSGLNAHPDYAPRMVKELSEITGKPLALSNNLFESMQSMADFAAFNAVYAEYFTGKPARSCVAARELPKKLLCEIEVIAEYR